MAEKKKQINFQVSDEESERFDRVAEHYGIPMAAMIRMLVKEKDEAISKPGRLAEQEYLRLLEALNAAIALARRGEPPSDVPLVGKLAIDDVVDSLMVADDVRGYADTFRSVARRLTTSLQLPKRTVTPNLRRANLRSLEHLVNELAHLRDLIAQEIRPKLLKM
jgi:antitoxin component of RelBE/YafQ-DinJ toxin-antitoxin module